MIFSRRGPGRITVPQAHRMLQAGTAALLDVRETDEFRAGHVPGALHVPLSRLSGGTASIPTEHALVLICRSGNRSQRAAALLAERGVAAVDVVGGMRDWAARGLPVEDAHGAAGTVV
ncbi:rhodanese-like domain-containing protein [Streptomyces phyllanthi]|uniref:Rhodanese-like domain-containing protein n=1 Tax=Streptomyces phyllanthi TaxID=1803180 RepID=A0A5N8W477_9ACTN|nr:rhodanese-like domain-containing protein [Streptomyces phyllanthi]MPY41138.1 rhodanese-like domain-containing protein [Streptomyces phyllanthi]